MILIGASSLVLKLGKLGVQLELCNTKQQDRANKTEIVVNGK